MRTPAPASKPDSGSGSIAGAVPTPTPEGSPAPAPGPLPNPTAPPPPPPPAPAPAPLPNPTDLGNSLFNGAHLSDFALVQSAAADRIQEVPDPLGGGQTVFKVSVKNSDVAPLTPTQNPRAQALSPSFIKPGMEFWIHHSVLFPSDFPSSIPGWLGLMSVYGPPFNGSSPVGMGVRGNQITMNRGSTYNYDTPWSMPLVKNKWVDILIHERFATDGWVELYINGKQVSLNGQSRLMMRTVDASNDGGPNHVKFSVYFQAGMFPSLTMYHSALRVGTTRASVGG